MINIGFRPEYIVEIFGTKFSNSLTTSLVVSVSLTILALYFYFSQKKGGFLIKIIHATLYELVKFIDEVTQSRALTYQVLPLVATFFIYIFCANLFALFPGFLGSLYVNVKGVNLPLLRSPNSDLNTTLSLALVSVVATQYFSIKFLGLGGYLRRYINFRSPITFITGFFEIISEGVKIISFSFRLFGNIFAGEVLLLITAFLVPYIIPLPFMFLEIFVGIIQAFIFAMLTLTFIKTATLKHIKASETLQKPVQSLN